MAGEEEDVSHAEKMSDVFAEPFGKSKPAPATVKEGWTMPSGTCPECGRQLVAVAISDADCISPFLDCPDECCGEPQEVDWPFEHKAVMFSDFRALGFEVIVA